MLSGEQLLEQAAKDGSIVCSDWPRALQTLLSMIESIVRNEFPTSTIPDARVASRQPSVPLPESPPLSQGATSTDKENAPPTGPPLLPQPMLQSYDNIVHKLSMDFPEGPPFTMQRVAELVRQPRAHYRTRLSWLHALERTVNVSSTKTTFPLPQTAGSDLPNGSTPSPAAALGSDESLGGALLTPIPWVQNRARPSSAGSGSSELDGLNGAGRIETVSVVNGALASVASRPSPTGGVTQGELLRLEQEAGVVPIGLLHEQPEDATRARGLDDVRAQDVGPRRDDPSREVNMQAAVDQAARGAAATARREEDGVCDDQKDVEMTDAYSDPDTDAAVP